MKPLASGACGDTVRAVFGPAARASLTLVLLLGLGTGPVPGIGGSPVRAAPPPPTTVVVDADAEAAPDSLEPGLVGAGVGTLVGLGLPWLLHYRFGEVETSESKPAGPTFNLAPMGLGLGAFGTF